MARRLTEIAEEEERATWLARLGGFIVRRPHDAVALLAAVSAVIAIAANALVLQRGPHPAPLFALRLLSPEAAASANAPDVAVPRPRPVVGVSDTASSTPRSRSEIVAEIQRELARRGFYSGNVDGVHGPRTDAALRDFAQAAQLRLDPEPTESVLQRIVESGASRSRQEGPAPPNRGRRDPIADLLEPQPRIVAVQRALADFGYGQIKPTGVIGPETVAAIEKFERSRQLPVTGRLSERLLRELAAVTGRPLTD